jgi:hypothetical protein
MLDFFGNAASVIITVITLIGFLAIAGVALFEVGALFYFWVKHALSDSKGERTTNLPPAGFRRVRPQL